MFQDKLSSNPSSLAAEKAVRDRTKNACKNAAHPTIFVVVLGACGYGFIRLYGMRIRYFISYVHASEKYP